MDQSTRSIMTQTEFRLGDYLIFILTLFTSMVIGIYYAWRGVNNSTSDYLMGRKRMGVFPITMSLAASSISASMLIGIPMDVYLTGSMYLWIVVAIGFSIPVSTYIYLPVYHQLRLLSINQYLEMRFNRIIRRLISLLYIFKVLFYVAIVVYGPSLALKKVTGIEVHVILSIIFAVCIFYTAVGGFKAVVWTGTIQIFVIYASIIVVLIKSFIDLDGPGTVFSRSLNSSRIEFFNTDFDPTTRHTVWSLSIGGFFLFTSMYATDQVFIQRCLAVPTLREARTSHWISLIMLTGIILLCCLTGLVAYAYYFDCDPLKSNAIEKADEIFPLLVINTIGKYPGLPGLFVSGIFSGAFSNLSCHLHSVALIVLEDLVRPFFPTMSDITATLVSKMASIAFGCSVFGMVFVVSSFNTSMDVSLSFCGGIGGVILGVFTLGMFVPWANSTGAGVAAIASLSFMIWLSVTAQLSTLAEEVLNKQTKLYSTENCPRSNITNRNSATIDFFVQKEDEFNLLRISYLWYSLVSMMIVLVVGTAVSFLSGKQDPNQLNSKLLCKIVRSRRLSSIPIQPTANQGGTH